MSSYKNAAEILPPHLLLELQRYAAGEQIYVPCPAKRVGWGERSGARAALAERNADIRNRRVGGASIDHLAAEYHLSYDSIRKILTGKNDSNGSRC